MKSVNELNIILQELVCLNKYHSELLANIILAIIQAKTIVLTKLSPYIDTSSQLSSKYRRLQRFFAKVYLPQELLAKLVMALFIQKGDKVILIIDRTNWKLGKAKINIFMLSLYWNNIGIPIFFTLLPKEGSSSTSDRIKLLTKFISVFGIEIIEDLLGDREFVGKRWFSWLKKNKIPFTIRIKKNTKIRDRNVTSLFRGVTKYTSWWFETLSIYGVKLYIHGSKTTDNELIIVVTNHAPAKSLERYSFRWAIEHSFELMKTKGFNLEDTHLVKPERLETLIITLSISFAWCCKIGDIIVAQGLTKIKSHGRLAKSIFRYGLDSLLVMLSNLDIYFQSFMYCVKYFFNNNNLNCRGAPDFKVFV